MALRATVEVSVCKMPTATNPRGPVIVPPTKSPALKKPEAVRIRIFENALLEKEQLKRSSRPAELLVALAFHAIAIGGPILAGLYYTDTLDVRAFTMTTLVAPPPPPPPAAPAAAAIKTQAPKRVFMQEGKLLAPTYIPRQVAQIKEAPLEPEAMGGVAGGVPGGVPGGQLGGVIGGIVGAASQTQVPLPPAAMNSRTPIRVGGRVRPPRMVYRAAPVYPVLAKATHLQGVVQIDSVIDAEGNVVEMKAVSGPPLLIQAALDAVKQWKFEPTYLNDQPVSVQLVVTVTFQLD